jgi:hypothetical protein
MAQGIGPEPPYHKNFKKKSVDWMYENQIVK